MRIAGHTIGPRGIAVLAVSAVVGVLLGLHGWSGRHNGLPSTLASSGPRPSAPARVSRPARSPAITSPATTSPATPSPATPSPAPSPGPKLSSQSYASYSYQVWPGPLSTAAKAAATGLVIAVHRHGSGIMVTAGVAGRPAPTPRFYPAGAKVFVVEAALGDDSGNSDYNLGDDGLVVTNSQERILQ